MTDRGGPVITAVARTPFGRFGGALSGLSAAELGARSIDAVLARSGVPIDGIDAVHAGVGMIGAATLTPARQAVMLSKLPITTPSLAIDRACCSGMTALGLAAKDIRLGEAAAVVCGGFELLSATPRFMPRSSAARPGVVEMEDPLLLRAPVVDRQIAVYTGEEALIHGVTREMQDEWALASHERYHAAQSRGFFSFERVAVEAPDPKGRIATVERDESPRADSTLAKLAALKPVYGGTTVTAGNAPGLSDGAAFLLAMSAEAAARMGIDQLARVVGYTQVASRPTSGTSTPALAIAKLLHAHDLSIDALDLIEINEAYAATPLVSTQVLADGDHMRVRALQARTNINGGAVAIGHPLGASGARIVMTLIACLHARGGGKGIAAICGGFGQGDAVLIEV
ncbi:thiolase family protein [Sphingopyxis granuli]|uniref:thiolase family protein n=1 Tax=Sphingopyxis granuli TaxID=267128 RepID=UPI001BAFD07C|nr:thiolase family protein [Sphingopyxis granuli]QUM71014.1 thiolase family protein [Sphingopyxis granuli]